MAALLTSALLLLPLRAAVVINELQSGASDRLLQWDATGTPHVGGSTPWQAVAFNDASWQTGPGPFGYGTLSPAQTYGTNVGSQMQYLTPSLYLRKTINVTSTDAQRTDPIQLTMSYDDGFICWINGVEVARRWAGPARQFNYHDQPAYNPDLSTTSKAATAVTETLTLGAANTLLVPGVNVIAIQSLNFSSTNTNLLCKPDFKISGATLTTLALNTDTWKYLPGVVEPSAGVYDPALLFQGRLNVPWGLATFDDSLWSSGSGPLRAGTSGSGTVVSGVIGVTPSLYARTSFTATAAQAAETLPMSLVVDYDDSFVAYLNGVEVARANVGSPNAFTPCTAVASLTHNSGSGVTFVIDAPASLLVAGTNELAIQTHNFTVSDSDLFIKADLKTNAGASLVVNTQTWRYFVGTAEPIPDLSDNDDDDNGPDAPDSVTDWVELYNNGPTAVSLMGWSITDDAKKPAKWVFPNVNIPAGGYLVVICDGQDLANLAGGYQHTNFSLSAAGEYLGLFDASGSAMDVLAPSFPPQDTLHSYGRDASGALVYFDSPTPGAANSGASESGFAIAPTFSRASGFYTGTQTIVLNSLTAGATIRYTLDGSEPTATTGNLYGTSLPVSVTAVIRARAFASGLIPSPIVTRNYVINANSAQSSLPAIFITADQQRSLYRPYGNMAINGDASSNFPAGTWSALSDPSQYNNPNVSGKAMERAANLELVYPGSTSPGSAYVGFNKDFGLRISGSPYTRPRYQLTQQNAAANPNSGTWTNSATYKPSANFYFRDELGGDTLTVPIFPNSPITSYHDLRFRAGHNDTTPFVQDELVRRLYLDMGQVGSAGILTTLWVDGVYKGWYNLCEHLKEDFFQKSYNTSASFDVSQVAVASSGDLLAYQEMITYLRGHLPFDWASEATLASYQAMQTRLDMVNFTDYLLVNTYCETQDWPHNNFVCERPRVAGGVFRFHCWDAEGSFGSFSGGIRSNSFRNNTIQPLGSPLLTSSTDASLIDGIKILYSYLHSSAEFRLLFADRVQKHLVNTNGALYKTNFASRFSALKTQIAPFLNPSDRVTVWLNGTGDTTRYTTSGATNSPSRATIMLTGYYDDTQTGAFIPAQLKSEGLWPDTLAPAFSQLAGTVPAGSSLTITNPNSTGTIYYTANGSDPRAAGGSAVGTPIASGSSVTINQSTLVRARVLNTTGEWSPLQEQLYRVTVAPAILITELMYNPPTSGSTSGDQFEFVEIKNTTSAPVALNGWQLADGVSFTFPAGASIGANSFLLVVKDPVNFAAKYPSVSSSLIAGTYTGSLDNSGELVTLRDLSGAIVMGVTYSSTSPWPTLPNGYGNSLVPVDPNHNASPNSPASWRASAALGGSPGADDPSPTVIPVQVNELLANAASGQKDTVELYNPDLTQAADLSYWFLSDDPATPRKFVFPSGTVIPAGGYLVVTEDDFNAAAPVNGNTPFAFSNDGESVVLSVADSTGTISSVADTFAFGASSPGVSFGRYVNSVGTVSHPAQSANTFGAANAGPLVGPVVITEMMVQPPADPNPAAPVHGAIYHEFVEIQNTSSSSVPLYDPKDTSTGGWKIDGYGWTFPAGIDLAPGQMALVVPLSESDWRTKYPDTPAKVRIFGPCTGNLKDTGEAITLQKPGAKGTDGKFSLIDGDKVTYTNASPWPTTVSGTGRTLERTNPLAYGDDPANWHASSAATGGTPGDPQRIDFATWQSRYFTATQIANPLVGGANADPDGDGLSNRLEWALGSNPLAANASAGSSTSLALDGTSGPFLTLQFRRSLAIPANSVTVDTTADLLNWNLAAGVQVGTSVDNGDGTETVTVRDTVPVSGPNPPSRYLRLRVIGN